MRDRGVNRTREPTFANLSREINVLFEICSPLSDEATRVIQVAGGPAVRVPDANLRSSRGYPRTEQRSKDTILLGDLRVKAL